MHKTALVMAGGTGGHVFPALATARCLEQQSVTIHWMGTQKGIESSVVPNAGIPLHTIDVQGLRGKGRLSLLLAPFKLIKAIWQAVKVVRKVRPDVVLGMGGFASGPGAVAARLLGVPLVIHEQNAVAGMTNRISAKLAQRILVAFPSAFSGSIKAEQTGNPVRGAILDLPEPGVRYSQRDGAINVLIVGGSLGAKAINDIVPEALAELSLEERPCVWHQTGKQNFDATQEKYSALNITARVDAFIEHMDEAYGWADLVICRSGALTISELAIAGVPALLIPFPFAVDDHQTGNARYLEEAGAAWIIQQSDLKKDDLVNILRNKTDRRSLLEMALKARSVAKPNASIDVARICLESMK
ncbi:undecaprenyldiphospho-muramoylpentapeptide beta-N-acetylglucosaminyltransferase [Neptunomonas japonica]|uniref:UDP-N-acetylglucosamine--N-acetylmuramyl-(pentapeptide) pyrophosphoryl-undecaprenol N-acetylglucosamine transferase n=1 Tax=Neptunomonas japonica JAMM 1380 TaxID=1441457 RepID=A0A7R6PIJ5_9GAMM|nr:undecaprenyldiphospho-muramoylpentapeptide beta-N-acetylglucosaminyltransferase [Neptunomonas japonica]BBB28916.1 UDP-N-acetylglucosamine--N-acetylmuramyl-(pentapeptide) pyrophosphoryl-undecaprenol N-acetylglucosamine transferase [Neptunomonas japonica JAMM 1380]